MKIKFTENRHQQKKLNFIFICTIRSLQLGDRIKVAHLVAAPTAENPLNKRFVYSFSEIIALPHPHNNILALFLHIHTENGSSIKLTPYHLIFSRACDSLINASTALQLKYASDVSIGECVQTEHGEERVNVVESIYERGIYSAITAASNSYLVVNGVVASPYALNHNKVDAFYDIFRLLYKFLPSAILSSNYFISCYSKFSYFIVNLSKIMF